jgi:predicted phage terminase large subunit-like protein
VIFRRNYNQITAEGGLWDASNKIFGQVPDAHPRKSPKLHWRFDGGSKLSFAHIERDEDLKSWQGTEIPYIGLDELTHFTKHQFLYMLSRNRTTCGVRPYVRATCNPDSDSWVAEFISWWIDADTGYAIPERSGQIRWMVVLNDIIHWGNSPEELAEKYEVSVDDCKSVTFIASRLEDNKILMDSDPGYLANLKAMTEVDMERLLRGNWKIKAASGSFFKRSQIGEILPEVPKDLVAVCRGWDLAATDKGENDEAAFTSGVLMGKRENGRYVIIDVINRQLKAGDVRSTVLVTAKLDHAKHSWCRQRLPQDPGQAGKDQKGSYMEMLAGFDVHMIPESGDKATRAEPMAAQWQHGMFDLVVGEWNEEYLNQLESFPDSKWKDMVDASSSAFNEITLGMGFNIENLL